MAAKQRLRPFEILPLENPKKHLPVLKRLCLNGDSEFNDLILTIKKPHLKLATFNHGVLAKARNGRIVGWAAAYRTKRTHYTHTSMVPRIGVYVSKRCRRRGIGKALANAIINMTPPAERQANGLFWARFRRVRVYDKRTNWDNW